MPETPEKAIEKTSPIPYWIEYVRTDGAWRTDPVTGGPKRPPGEDLAAMRSGLGSNAWQVPALWPHYRIPVDDRLARVGKVSPAQEAEHAALALYGLHQQSQDQPMHRPKVGFGQALRAVRTSGRFSEEAVDRRMEGLASATSVPVLVYRLRGSVEQLRTIKQPLDYTQLMKDIAAWHRPQSRLRVRRNWGLGYYGRSRTDSVSRDAS
ncbi:type I-E CRISPR-associated protein Cse2/CasB [Streptomyces sp. NBC_00133]|uniref:type I-E CRISPR-associated protein Cse2/CasB n=1 Tax=Streptomyces sp. NBC_00133 TaxID=2903624 RepID=UPI00324966D7